jgi:lantibiotic modifying enzyme
VIAEIYRAVSAGLRAEVPLFTERLADGLGFAEGPPGALSFGENRCQLIAQALWLAFSWGLVDRDSRAALVTSEFRQNGLDPERPHLRPGAVDGNQSSSLRLKPSGAAVLAQNLAAKTPRDFRATILGGDPALAAATAIGRELCRSAYWDHERQHCNWMGRSTAEVSEPGGPITPRAAALGADLYGGSAGIAVFLAQLHALTGDSEFRATALGAINRSIVGIGRVRLPAPLSPLSFFCGHLGVLHAARRVSDLTGDAGLAAQAQLILKDVAASARGAHELDVISGNAGAIPALLELSRSTGLEECREIAIELGHELLETAIRSGHGWFWRPSVTSASESGSAPITGFAHGAAGMGLALFELHAATGRTDFLDAARSALRCVDQQFDPQQGNWPDRMLAGDSEGCFGNRTFSTGWCHGAPGIALAHLRAAATLAEGRDDHVAMARTGIAATLHAIQQRLAEPRVDASLCHGLSGLGEVVLIASQILDEPTYRECALALGAALIDRHAASGDWPSGVPSGGPSPSLMLGTAGIGYWLLRLIDPARVSPVLLQIHWPR